MTKEQTLLTGSVPKRLVDFALGDSKSPLYFVGIATMINIVMDIMLVGLFGMGTAGAAYATITAYSHPDGSSKLGLSAGDRCLSAGEKVINRSKPSPGQSVL